MRRVCSSNKASTSACEPRCSPTGAPAYPAWVISAKICPAGVWRSPVIGLPTTIIRSGGGHVREEHPHSVDVRVKILTADAVSDAPDVRDLDLVIQGLVVSAVMSRVGQAMFAAVSRQSGCVDATLVAMMGSS